MKVSDTAVCAYRLQDQLLKILEDACSKGSIDNAGRMAPEHNVTGGLMAAVGLSAEAAEARLQKEGLRGTVVGCDNSPTSVTLAGRCP